MKFCLWIALAVILQWQVQAQESRVMKKVAEENIGKVSPNRLVLPKEPLIETGKKFVSGLDVQDNIKQKSFSMESSRKKYEEESSEAKGATVLGPLTEPEKPEMKKYFKTMRAPVSTPD